MTLTTKALVEAIEASKRRIKVQIKKHPWHDWEDEDIEVVDANLLKAKLREMEEGGLDSLSSK